MDQLELGGQEGPSSELRDPISSKKYKESFHYNFDKSTSVSNNILENDKW